MSNPLDVPHVEAHVTDTLPARTVFHQTQAAVHSLTNHIQTQGEMDDLLEKIAELREEYVEEIHRPPTIKHKGRPRSQRLTGVLEGRARGGGGSLLRSRQAGVKDRLCGVCRTSGHNRATCPLIDHLR
ncbi:hypothetical protein L208DRAFT_1279028 [Tricholoma matsutake]|nr:hypothetical protein L208DRAFT_1279028 [Tricholoma matsutake 945]